MTTIWSATGNNLSYGSDLGRRVLPIRLHTPEERPEDRKDFRHPNLLEWVAENRPRLAVEAITMLRAYFVANCPKVDSKTWGSFESWTSIIRGSLVWAGIACPLSNREHASRSDESRNLLGLLVTGLIEAKQSLTSSQFESVYGAPALTEAVKQICPLKFNAKSIAKKLSGFRGRRWEGYEIDATEGHGGIKRWYAKKSTNGGFGGIGGIDSPNLHVRTEIDPPILDGVNAYTCTEPGVTNPPKPPIQPSIDTRMNEEGLLF